MIFSALYAVHLSFIIPDAVIEETPVIQEIKSSSITLILWVYQNSLKWL